MIPKQDDLRASAKSDSHGRSVNITESDKGCYNSLTNRNRNTAFEGLSPAARTLIEARFWAKVNKTPTCWLWTASATKGYGQFVSARPGYQSHHQSHRVSYEIAHGSIPNGMSVLHRCDVPLCVNPDHLFLGTQSDNLADARAKGRLIPGRHLIKVSDAARMDIRTNYRPRQNGKQLAAKYGVTLVHMLRIVAGTDRVQRPVFEHVPHVDVTVRGEVA